jgi:hypothetical protein
MGLGFTYVDAQKADIIERMIILTDELAKTSNNFDKLVILVVEDMVLSIKAFYQINML